MNNSRTNKIRKALYNARTSKGMLADTLAKLVGVSKTTIYGYEKGEIEKMPMQTLSKLSNVLGISSAFIAGLDDNPSLVDYVKGDENRSSNTVMVPILGTIACGDPTTAEENIEGYLEEPEDSLPSGTVFYLVAKGHSMEPTIPNGSNVLIREQPEVEDDEIAAVLVNSDTEATLKRVKHSGNIVMLMPDNKDYDTIIVTKDSPARILGKAIRYTTEL